MSTSSAPAQIHFKQRMKANKISTLSDSIQELRKALDKEKGVQNSITKLSTRFNIKRRRLYDVVNVLISTGCCEKGEFDCIIWMGENQIYQKFADLYRVRQIGNSTMTIDELFPIEICVGVPNLTINFILVYFALQTQCLDLRIIAALFSRGTQRMKTTLSKLYQISYILCSIGVTKRSTQVCEVVLEDYLYQYVLNSNNTNPDSKEDPLSIFNLLNIPQHDDLHEAILNRRKMFNQYFIDNAYKADFIQQF
ncbi:hypothetical protein TVAG_115630 [Trichomonas vaginalis G3]|uniref:E2F/DP family winged-helix DNA-binding domain-containing protein n=1 Tax=Trichomonas vaginalis (strain ATCC PRA-98 / G3) TaxID=412133 RepID=A2EH36_TRIV3|nr:transcription factor, enhancer of yellow 2 family [Trichomonas vaginalis G3]EAY08004.1 hypothetical protein TVAG_115630 [Trichomonas vaginalis G3]KAI5537376.1 transcription factor, enhancer of yellow 2 family [Trichomonas vaginalis G3]|eukprot:XP_001320227.1 hypothetical protein [Trichomonas vaginalis G3]